MSDYISILQHDSLSENQTFFSSLKAMNTNLTVDSFIAQYPHQDRC